MDESIDERMGLLMDGLIYWLMDGFIFRWIDLLTDE